MNILEELSLGNTTRNINKGTLTDIKPMVEFLGEILEHFDNRTKLRLRKKIMG